MKGALPGALAWCTGLLAILALPARQNGMPATVGAFLALALAVGLVAAGLWRRRASLFDVALVAAFVATGLRDPGMDSATGQGLLIGAFALQVFGVALLTRATRPAGAPVRAVALQAAMTLGLAMACAFAFLRLPAWSASLVSARWADSLDATSVPLLAVLGLLATAAAAGLTALRVLARRVAKAQTA